MVPSEKDNIMWLRIMLFIIKIIEMVGETFFGGNPNGKGKSGQ